MARPLAAPLPRRAPRPPRAVPDSGRASAARGVRARTGSLPRVPPELLLGPRTLEARALPLSFAAVFAGLIAIQVALRWP